MSISAITASALAASAYSGVAGAIVSVVTSTSPDGAMITITTTYGNGTTSTVTQPAPPSTVSSKQVTTMNSDGSLTMTTYYADGRTPTTTQANANPPAVPNPLDPTVPVASGLLLWA
jgi:hypothetical protein